MTSPDVGVTITPRAQAYGTIARAATATRAFTIALAGSYPVGRSVTVSVHVAFTGALSPVDAVSRIATGHPAPTARTFGYRGAPVAIPDNAPAGTSVSIPVAGVGYASAVTFSVDGSACTTSRGATTVGIDHTYVSDLTGTLIAPGGQSARLFDHAGSSGVNLCQVVFDDRASEPLSAAPPERNPFTGSWKPVGPLSGVRTAAVDGTWKFEVVDSSARDVGSIRAVSLHITGYLPT